MTCFSFFSRKTDKWNGSCHLLIFCRRKQDFPLVKASIPRSCINPDVGNRHFFPKIFLLVDIFFYYQYLSQCMRFWYLALESSESSDKPAHLSSLPRAFAVHTQNIWKLMKIQTQNLASCSYTSDKWQHKIDNTKILMTNGSLMKVESIAKCFPWSILQYFWPALSDNQAWTNFWSFWEWPFYTGFTVHTIMAWTGSFCLPFLKSFLEVV